jgi:hypothetical protein
MDLLINTQPSSIAASELGSSNHQGGEQPAIYYWLIKTAIYDPSQHTVQIMHTCSFHVKN